MPTDKQTGRYSEAYAHTALTWRDQLIKVMKSVLFHGAFFVTEFIFYGATELPSWAADKFEGMQIELECLSAVQSVC